MDYMEYNEVVELFLGLKCKAENTRNAYTVNLNKLKSYLREKNVSYQNLKPYQLEVLLKELSNKYSDATIYQITCTLRKFFLFLYDNNFMKKNIAGKLELIQPDNESDVYLDSIEVHLLLTYLKDHEKWNNIRYFEFKKPRDLFLLTLALKHGYRVEEILTLTEENFDFENKIITVFAKDRKNNKDVKNRLDDELINLYNDYIEVRPSCNPKDNYIFLSVRGRKMATNKTTDMLQERIAEANMYFELNKDKYSNIEIKAIKGKEEGISMHKLRHTSSYLMSTNGYSLQEIGSVLGQKSIMVTMRYAHTNLNDLDKKSFKLLG